MIKIKNYSYSYNSYVECLKNVNMEFEKGYMYAIIGPSGSGKTTLFSSITGFAKGNGSIKVFNEFAPRKFTNHISVNFQKDDLKLGAIVVPSSVLDYARKLGKVAKNFDAKLFNRYINRFNIPVGIDYSKLSQGQQSLVDISLTLSYETDLYLLDEPFSNIDYILKNEVMKCFKEKVIDGKCVIISSHNIKILDASVDYVYFLKDKTNFDIVDVSTIETDLTDLYETIYKEAEGND